MTENKALSQAKIWGLANISRQHSQLAFITVPPSSNQIKILFPKGFQLIVTAITSALFWPAIAEP